MKKTIGYLLPAFSVLLIVSGTGCLIYIYLLADAPASGMFRFFAWINSVNGLLGLVNWYNYYYKKA